MARHFDLLYQMEPGSSGVAGVTRPAACYPLPILARDALVAAGICRFRGVRRENDRPGLVTFAAVTPFVVADTVKEKSCSSNLSLSPILPLTAA